MRILISFAALFLSIALLQLSVGAMGPLDALSGLQEGFSKTQVGLLGSAHFLGFFVGCWWSPRLMGTIGHSRAFVVFASCGAIGVIAHPLLIDANLWAVLRIMTGLCVAGCYTVAEAWMQAKLTNESRGRVMGTYRVVDIGASSLAQLMIGVLEPASYISYNILAILCCACMLPLALTSKQQPTVSSTPRLRPIRTAMVSPLGAAGVMVAGTTSAAFRMVGPVYGQEVGMNLVQIGYFLSIVLLGGALAQFPVGWLADKFDRRKVLIAQSIASIAICTALSLIGIGDYTLIFIFAGLFGATTYPIFSVSTAHANDFTAAKDVVEVNASLMFLYGIGAIFSPIIASGLIDNYGPAALFSFISAAHLLLVIFGILRMAVRPTHRDRTEYTYTPRTSFLVGKLLRQKNTTDGEPD